MDRQSRHRHLYQFDPYSRMSEDQARSVVLLRRLMFLDTSYSYPFYQIIILALIYWFPVTFLLSFLIHPIISIGAEAPGSEEYVLKSFMIGFQGSLFLFAVLLVRYLVITRNASTGKQG